MYCSSELYLSEIDEFICCLTINLLAEINVILLSELTSGVIKGSILRDVWSLGFHFWACWFVAWVIHSFFSPRAKTPATGHGHLLLPFVPIQKLPRRVKKHSKITRYCC